MAQIFISYSRKDIGFVRKLAGDLEKAGYEVWWDLTDLRGGDDWLRVIPSAIESSEHFIVVLSPNSVISDWVKKEYTQALSLRKKIIPLMLARTTIPFALNTINYVDFTSDDYAVNLQSLLDAIGYTGENPVTTTSAFPLMLRKYAIPVILVTGFLLAALSTFLLVPLVVTTATPSNPAPTATPSPSATVTSTREADTPTPTTLPSSTVTPSPTQSATQTPTVTPSRTNVPFNRLGLCVESDFANSINVRSGPGTIYVPLGEPLLVGTCLFFSARNEEATWLQVAPNQQDASLRQYEGGWIYRELLGLGTMGPIDLPAVTLTPTPLPSETPTITPTLTRTPTATFTPSETATETPSPTETETPTETATP